MAKFRGFPVNYMPINLQDKNGSVFDDGYRHAFAAGWLQGFSDVNSILSGNWLSTAPVEGQESNCEWTPWFAQVFVKFLTGGSFTLKMPAKYVGVLQVYGSDMVLKRNVLVDGDSLPITCDTGDILHGSLSPK